MLLHPVLWMHYGNALLENTGIFRPNVFINIIRRQVIRRLTLTRQLSVYRILPTTKIYSPSSQFAKRAKSCFITYKEKNTNPGAAPVIDSVHVVCTLAGAANAAGAWCVRQPLRPSTITATPTVLSSHKYEHV